MTSITVKTDRRHFLAVSAGAVAACAGLAVTGLPALANVDPIFAAIDSHLAAAKLVDENLSSTESSEFASMEAYAADYLVDTAPTTMAGLRALEAHLHKDRSILCRVIIRNRWLEETQPNGRMSAEYSAYVRAAPEGDHNRELMRRYYGRPLQAFIAKRAAEIDRG